MNKKEILDKLLKFENDLAEIKNGFNKFIELDKLLSVIEKELIELRKERQELLKQIPVHNCNENLEGIYDGLTTGCAIRYKCRICGKECIPFNNCTTGSILPNIYSGDISPITGSDKMDSGTSTHLGMNTGIISYSGHSSSLNALGDTTIANNKNTPFTLTN